MKRKTNLFYKTDIDSNFLTFSNYTESMTGNFLATDVKLFPDKFLCLNMPSLEQEDEDKKQELIELLAARYENKMAFMRDRLAYEGASQDKKMHPLGWLLDTLISFDSYTSIPFVGQVAEQDYNGVFADTICVIDGTACRRASIITNVSYENIESTDSDDESDVDEVTYEAAPLELSFSGDYEDYSYESQTCLYGWAEKDSETGTDTFIGPDEWANAKPVTDEDNKYYWDPSSSYIRINEDAAREDIAFNVVIPLFDVINIDSHENDDIIQDMQEIDCRSSVSNIINVPLGIWFAKSMITLTRDDTDYGPSWSLAIGSQFKPFPYSFNKIEEVGQSAKAEAFMTFASVLSKQNDIMVRFEEFSSVLSSLQQQISDVQSQLSNISTSYSLESVKEDVIKLQDEVSYLYDKLPV